MILAGPFYRPVGELQKPSSAPRVTESSSGNATRVLEIDGLQRLALVARRSAFRILDQFANGGVERTVELTTDIALLDRVLHACLRDDQLGGLALLLRGLLLLGCHFVAPLIALRRASEPKSRLDLSRLVVRLAPQ